jgi:hypothetical protein
MPLNTVREAAAGSRNWGGNCTARTRRWPRPLPCLCCQKKFSAILHEGEDARSAWKIVRPRCSPSRRPVPRARALLSPETWWGWIAAPSRIFEQGNGQGYTRRTVQPGKAMTVKEMGPAVATRRVFSPTGMMRIKRMFGFGLSSLDKEIISILEVMLASWGLSEIAAKDTVRNVFEATKREVKSQFGGNIYATDAGDVFIKNDLFMAPRRTAGVTDSDVQRYWNRPVLLVLAESKLLMMGVATFVSDLSAKAQAGWDPLEAAREFRKVVPDYGDPTKWDHKHPAHRGLTLEDIHIYPELMPRVDAWCKRTSEEELKSLLRQYSTYNAMIRDLIRRGTL